MRPADLDVPVRVVDEPPAEHDEPNATALRPYAILDTPPEPTFEDLADLARHLFDAPIAVVSFPHGARHWFKAHPGLEVGELPRGTPLDEALSPAQDAVVLPDVHALAAHRTADVPFATRFAAAAPLVVPGGRAVGVLAVLDTRPRQPTPAQLAALRALARQVVSQIELRRALLAHKAHAAERQRAEQMQRFLSEASTVLVSPLDVEATLRKLARMAVPALGDRCAIDLVDGDAARRVAPGPSAAPRPLPATVLAGRTLHAADAEAARAADAALDEHLAGLGPDGVAAALVVPLVSRGRVLGALTFTIERSTPRSFEQEDVALAVDLGRRIAAALDNARLFAEAEAAKRRLTELIDSTDGILWEADPATRSFTYVSRRAEKILGYPVSAWLAEPGFWADRLHPDDRAWAVDFRRAQEAAAKDYEIEYRMIAADGRTVWLRDSVYVSAGADGTPTTLRGLMIDVTDRKRLEEARLALLSQVESQRRRLDAIISSVPGVVWEAWREPSKADQRTDFVSDYVEKMLGYSVSEWLSKPNFWLAIVHPEDRASAAEQSEEAFRAGHGVASFRWVAKGGRILHCRSYSTTIFDGRKPVGMRGVTLDVTDERRALEDLKSLAEALERSNKELDQFAYITSHDLKAPLRGIANLSRFLEEDLGDRVDEQAGEHLRLMRGRVARMEALIDAILEYSRVGRVKTRPEAVDVGALVRDVVDLLAPPPGFSIEVERGAMPTVVTEKVRLQQVFHNLIANAIKHHHRKEAGHVWIGVEDAGPCWRFSVRDDGPGIAPEFHERIFVIFQTLQPRDKVEGTGVGLALVKKIVESHGGSVTVESAPGRGSAFHFTWPKEATQP